jgi:uncharacterized protein YlxP (DUF503 family)
MDDVRTYTGTLIADLVLPHARSLKERRGPQRALMQKLKNQDFAVAQIGPAELVQRLFLAVAVVSGRESLVDELLDGAERLIFASDFEVAELRRRIDVDSFHSG